MARTAIVDDIALPIIIIKSFKHCENAMRIRAAVVERKSGPFVFRELELDDPRPDEILVRIVATGVCQTDAHIRNQSYQTPLPIILGHEGAGVVEKIGAEVTSVKVGDHVIMSYQSCGHCDYCLGGHGPYCENGFELCFGGARLDGSNALHDNVHGHFFGQSSFASHSIATERNVVKVPSDLSLELLGPLGCGMQTGAGAVLNSLKVQPGSSIAVFGTGGVGLAAIMAARVAGAAPIIAVDISDERLALAAELGATHLINGAKEDVKSRVFDIAPHGVDYALEITAQPKMLTLAIDVLALMGQAALIGGAPSGTQAAVDMNQLLNGRSVRGVIQGDATPQIFLPKLIELYRTGRFPFDRLVRFYDFDDIEKAFEDARSGHTIKPILRIGKL